MPASGNGMVPNAHLRKHWQNRIKTWFNQPARAARRSSTRIAKARTVAPRPLGLLRPIVRPSCIKHSHKVRLGRGFTVEELQQAGISKKDARQIGIAFDKRRKNKSMGAMRRNVNRLKEYKDKMILFPQNSKKTKKGEATEEEIKMATQLKGKTVMPLRKQIFQLESSMVIDPKIQKANVYSMLIQARSVECKWGWRAKKAREAAEEANVLKK